MAKKRWFHVKAQDLDTAERLEENMDAAGVEDVEVRGETVYWKSESQAKADRVLQAGRKRSILDVLMGR